MLDTNIVTHFIRQHPGVVGHVVAAPMASLCISAVTVGELLFGLAKRPEATRLHAAIREFLQRVEALSWDEAAAISYANVRVGLRNQGKTAAPLDLLIAAHAVSVDAVLVTNDRAFGQVPNLRLEDWST